MTVLALLDLSAAFDTIIHAILLSSFGNWGEGGSVLDSFSFFVQGWFQLVLIGGRDPAMAPTLWGALRLSSLSSPIKYLHEVAG